MELPKNQINKSYFFFRSNIQTKYGDKKLIQLLLYEQNSHHV